jgi:hypothetical protein
MLAVWWHGAGAGRSLRAARHPVTPRTLRAPRCAGRPPPRGRAAAAAAPGAASPQGPGAAQVGTRERPRRVTGENKQASNLIGQCSAPGRGAAARRPPTRKRTHAPPPAAGPPAGRALRGPLQAAPPAPAPAGARGREALRQPALGAAAARLSVHRRRPAPQHTPAPRPRGGSRAPCHSAPSASHPPAPIQLPHSPRQPGPLPC